MNFTMNYKYIDLVNDIIIDKPKVEIPPEKEQKKPRVIIVDGKITEIHVTQSLITKLYFKGEKSDRCWKQMYHLELIRDMNGITTDPMLYGTYFETGGIGSGAYGELSELPLLKNGQKSVANQRIDEQIFLFKSLYEKRGIILLDDRSNTQVHKLDPWNLMDSMISKIFLEGTADIVSPIEYENYVYDMCVIDLNLTWDRFGEQGYRTWGNLANMDHIQAYTYAFLF